MHVKRSVILTDRLGPDHDFASVENEVSFASWARAFESAGLLIRIVSLSEIRAPKFPKDLFRRALWLFLFFNQFSSRYDILRKKFP